MFRSCAECRSSRKAPIPFAFYSNFLLFHVHCSLCIEQYSVSLEVPVVLLFVRQRFVWKFCSNISAAVVHYFWQQWLPVNLPSCFSNWSYSTPDKTWQRDSRNAVAVTGFFLFTWHYIWGRIFSQSSWNTVVNRAMFALLENATPPTLSHLPLPITIPSLLPGWENLYSLQAWQH